MKEEFIEILVDEMDFKTVAKWAYILGVEYELSSQWLDDEWPDKEDELRVKVIDVMQEIFK